MQRYSSLRQTYSNEYINPHSAHNTFQQSMMNLMRSVSVMFNLLPNRTALAHFYETIFLVRIKVVRAPLR